MVLTQNLVSVGIDPGARGAIAFAYRTLAPDGVTRRLQVSRHRMPLTSDGEVNVSAIYEHVSICRDTPALLVCERVFGIRGQSASASFQFGWNACAAVTAAQLALRVEPTYLTKQVWARAVALPTGSSKADSIQRAKELFGWSDPLPGTRGVSDGEAEAGLIAYAGLLIHEAECGS